MGDILELGGFSSKPDLSMRGYLHKVLDGQLLDDLHWFTKKYANL